MGGHELTSTLSQDRCSPAAFARVTFVVVSLAVTLFHLQLADMKYPQPTAFWSTGSRSYGEIAISLVEFGEYSMNGAEPTGFRPPLYPYFLAFCMGLSDDVRIILVLQSMISGLTVGMLAAAAVAWTRLARTGIYLVVVSCLLIDIVGGSIVLHETFLFTFFMVAANFLFVRDIRSHHWSRSVALGVMLGLACLTRPLAYLGIAMVPMYGLVLLFKGDGFSAVVRRLLLLGGGLSFTLLPWGVWNALALGRFSVTSSTAGMNLWKGNNPAFDAIYPYLDVDVLEVVYGELPNESGWWDQMRGLGAAGEVEADGLLLRLGLDYIVQDPVSFVRRGFLKFWALWTPLQTPLGDGSIRLAQNGAVLEQWAGYAYPQMLYLVHLLVELFAVLGAVRLRRQPASWFALYWFVAMSGVHFVTFGETRFRRPFTMLFLPLTATGILCLERGVLRAWSAVRSRLAHPQD